MEAMTLIPGMMGLVAILSRLHCLDEKRRILQGRTECLSARMEDIEGEITPISVHRGRKRKQDDGLSRWNDEGQELVGKAQYLLSEAPGGCSFLRRVKMRWDVDRLVGALEIHDKKGEWLVRRALSDARGPCHGYYIPVKAVVSRVASNTLKQLEVLLKDDKVGGIAIHGVEGVGKTFMMKHLHNSALKWVEKFDHVFWVTISEQLSIKHLQDAVAKEVKCELAGYDDLNVRARKLSDTLVGLVSFVLFLDGVPGPDFSLDKVGIPVPVEGSKFKLVLTTSSTLEWRLSDYFKAVVIEPLEEEEAYDLFMQEAKIDKAFAASLSDTPRLLAYECCRIPHMIVNVATRMRGINDPHEWRNALFESMHRGGENEPPLEVVSSARV